MMKPHSSMGMAKKIIYEMGLKDTRAVRARIIKACEELEERYE